MGYGNSCPHFGHLMYPQLPIADDGHPRHANALA